MHALTAYPQKASWNYDSIMNVINTTKNSSDREYASALYSIKLGSKNIDSSKYYLKLASPLLKGNNDQAIADYHLAMGYLQNREQKPDSALVNLKKSYHLSLKRDFYRTCANAGSFIGMIYKISGENDSALYYLKIAKSLSEKNNNNYLVNKIDYDLGGVYTQRGQHEIAIKHYLNALRLQEMENDSFRILYTYSGLGNAYKHLKKSSKAKSYYLKAMRLDSLIPTANIEISNLSNLGLLYESNYKNTDSALYYFFLAMNKLPENDKSLAKLNLLINVGNTFYELKDYTKALKYYNKSYEFDIGLTNPYIYSAVLINKSLIYFHLGNYDSTYYLANRGLKIAKEINALDWQIQAHKNLFKADSATGQYISAIHHYQLFFSINDSMYNEDNLNRISELEVIYETEKKDALNKTLTDRNALDQQMIKNQRQIIIVTFIACVLFILLVFSVLRSIRKQKHINNKLNLVNAEINEKNKEIDEKNHLLIDQNKQLIRLNETKDKFFSVISHDLRGPFNALLGYLELLNSEFETLTEDEKKTMVKSVYKSSLNTYNLLVNLLDWARSQRGMLENNAEELDIYDVVEDAIDLVRQRADKKDLLIINQIDQRIMVLADKNLLSSVLLNLLNNAIKFSPRKTLIKINCQFENDSVIVHIIDQGIGIPKEKQNDLFKIGNSSQRIGTESEIGTGLGLVLVNEFVQLIGGKIWVKSEDGKGTEFSFSLPLSKK
jgi:signal transduction histidine kinase